MGIIETVIILSLYVYDGGNKTIEGWYHQDNLSTCLTAKRTAERNSGNQVQYTCSLEKCMMTTDQTGVKHVGIAGGVSANSGLRSRIQDLGSEHGWQVYIPKFEYCTDNAAMIAITAHYKFMRKEFLQMDTSPKPRMEFPQ